MDDIAAKCGLVACRFYVIGMCFGGHFNEKFELFFFSRTAGDLRVNILRRKRVRHPGTQVFVGKNLKKPLTHTHT